MPAHGGELINRYNKLVAERAPFVARWERMAPLMAPSRTSSVMDLSPGAIQTRGMYDSTTLHAAELHAMFISGQVINPSQRWFGYAMRDARVQKSDAVREWLEEIRDITLRNLAASNFYAEAPESLVDWGGFGTGLLLCEERSQPINRVVNGFRGLQFSAERTGKFLIQEGPDGLVDTLFRDFKWTVRQITTRWPNGNMPEAVKQAIQNGELDKQFKIVHCIYPRPHAERNGVGNRAMPYASAWLEYDSKTVIHESGYNRFPAAAPRYQKTPNEVYGRGRGDIAFPDTWTLNTAKRMGFEDWALKIRPPVLHRHDSVIGTLRLTPGAPTSINTHGQPIRDTIQPFETGSRPEVSQIKEDELRKSIRNIFFVEQILALLEVNKSEMTAFEFARKLELLFKLLGPVYGRLEWEWLYRHVDIVFDLQMAAGAFPAPPPEAFDSDGVVDLVFQNPIARSQRAGDAEALTLALNDLAPLAQVFGARALDRLDADRAADGIFDLRGVPALWQRSDDEIEALRAARQQQDEKDNALQDAAQIAESAGKAAPALAVLQQRAGAAGAPR